MRLIFIFLVCFPILSYSQLQESFNDGDYKTNPVWAGTDDYFIVNTDHELQLNDTEARAAYLSTPSQAIEEASWQITVKMDFNPSSSNYARIYLASDIEPLADANNALFVELGSADDNICLYKIENGNKEKLIEGLTDRLDQSNIEVVIKVTRTGNDWTLLSDLGAGWETEGQTNFEYNYPSVYFGIYCKYTKTRADKFFFDDISVNGLPYRDKTPPVINAFELVNGSQMRLTFNEALDASSIHTDDFTLQNSQRQPTSFVYNDDDFSITLFFEPILDDTEEEVLLVSNILDTDENTLVTQSFPFSYERIMVDKVELINRATIKLAFSKEVLIEGFDNMVLKLDNIETTPQQISSEDNFNYTIRLPEMLENGRSYKLSISGIMDAINDPVPEIDHTIMRYDANRFDVVFNEWMVDPNPSMGLPEVEFIELFNNTDYDINLSDWVLMVNDKTAYLPDSVIKANGFICLVSSGDIEQWNRSLPTVFIKGMPALGNSGFECCLFNQYNSIIDAFIYNPAQVNGEGFKKDGGWSTERIDTNNKSGSADNFHFSKELNGGTPGKINSVQDENPDNAAPQITSLKLFDKKQLLIDFSETMDFDNMSSIEITPALQISKQSYDTLFLNQLQVEFEDDLVTNAIHHLRSINIYDLAGNQLALETPISFGVPDTLEDGDIILNEVLFNPYPDAADFVELYNASDKLINLADLYFAEIKDNQIEKLHPISNEVQLFEPHSYTAITTNKESLLQHYQCQQPGAIIETTSLPPLPDDEGLVAISNKKGIILEQFSYHQNMHFDLLKDKEGVSLERLSWQQATQASNNWQSATSTAGFATPGYVNSQQLNSPVETNGIVSITPEVFTPNNDGSDDRLQIQINSQEANSIVTIRIFDSNGKEVRYLVNNQSLADNSLIFWDGLNDDGTRLKPGIYLIFVQCVYPSGKVHEEKISCVIGVGSK